MKHPTTHWRPVFEVLSVALLSYAVLVFEVALTRIFSLLLNYHFVFVIVSGALAGLGIGAMAANRQFKAVSGRLANLAGIPFALLAAASMLVIVRLPPVGMWTLPIFFLLAILPFVAAGFALAGIFQRAPRKMPLLYSADLIGAACGALTVIPLLDAFGGVNTVLFAASAAGAGALCLEASRRKLALASGGVFLVLLGGFLFVVRFGLEVRLPITDDPDKEMFFLLSDPALKANVVETRWSSFGRTDMVRSQLTPAQMMLFVDGAAGSVMYDVRAVLQNPRELAYVTAKYGGFFPLPLIREEEKRNALIIGPGGGKDILAARLGGVKDITAVEVNPDIVDIVKRYEQFNGGIFSSQFGVTTVVAEGRSFVRNVSTPYDLIFLAIPVTKSSRGVDGFGLTENYLFTVEAFADYLDRLTPNGRIVLVAHNEMEIYRLISLAAAAFNGQGIGEQDTMKRIYTIPTPLLPAVVVQKRPLTPEDASAIDERLKRLRLDKQPSYVPYRPHYPVTRDTNSPGGETLPVDDERLTSVADRRTTLAALADDANYDISPVGDDRPFFFNLDRGLPRPLGIFTASIGATVGGLACFRALRNRSRRNAITKALWTEPARKRLAVLSFLLGAGYMLVEIALFQKLILFVGQPQKALSVLLFSLLLGGGLGSLASSSVKGPISKIAVSSSIGVAIAVFLLLYFFGSLFALGISPRLASAAYLVPLGFVMGLPFPSAMRLACDHGLESQVSVMWAINCIASILGSALCIVVAHWFGYSWALLLGATSYLLAAVLLLRLSPAACRDTRPNTLPALDETSA